MTHKKWPALLAGATLIVLTLVFFWKILLTNLILSGVDVFLYFYPYKAYVTQALHQGRLPLWNPHLFMGVPLLANSQVGLFYPPNWLFLWLDVPKQVAWSIGLHVALAGIFMLIFVRQSLHMTWLASMVAAVLFAFGGYLGAQVEHINQLQVAAWLPLLFLFYDLGLHHQRRWLWLLFLALVIALTLLAGHTQTVFISLFGLGLYGLWQAIHAFTKSQITKQDSLTTHSNFTIFGYSSFIPSTTLRTGIRHSSLIIRSLIRYLWPLAAVSILAVALAAVQLIPTAELSRLSIRSEGLTFQEVVSFSLNPATLHYSLLPPFGLDLTQILGEAFGEWVAYLGISGLILALLGLFLSIWRPVARPFAFVALCGLGLSFGVYLGPLFLFDVFIGIDSNLFHNLARWSHPYFLLYSLVPGFDLFRVPTRWLLLYAFGMSVLAGFGFEALLRPTNLREHLATGWHWLQSHRKWRTVLLTIVIIMSLSLIIWKTPPITTLITWLILTTIALGLIYYATRNSYHATLLTKLVPFILLSLLLAELFWAAQTLNYNEPTTPQAYSSMRNAVTFLSSANPSNNNTPPDRFLSLSGITYDPGDLTDLQNVYGDRLSEKALHNLVVATKEKEVLFFNLPMVYGLHSIDGYDGGLLPLTQFITLQKLFLPSDKLSRDGRLRENLRFVPSNRLLSLLNTRWIITDKQFDAWIDGIFYDLQFPARLAPGQTINTSSLPDFPPTAIGLVSHLEGAADLPANSPVATVTITFADGNQDVISLKAGFDTAEGNYPASGAAHPQADIGVAWPYAEDGVDYIAVHSLPSAQQITNISVEATLPSGSFVLRGLSLIHQPTTTSRSVILSTEGDYRQVHSGDVKIYENRSVLPRAFVVHQTQIVENEAQAIAFMQSTQFDPANMLVRLPNDDEPVGLAFSGQPSPSDAATIVLYTPERVEIETTLDSPGWLLLTDTYYPGWQASIDGQPVDILQANVLFRAIPVSAGNHRVVFEFKPRSLRWGASITGVALLLWLIGVIIAGSSKNSN